MVTILMGQYVFFKGYLLPIINRLLNDETKAPFSFVLVPTPELAMQVVCAVPQLLSVLSVLVRSTAHLVA